MLQDAITTMMESSEDKEIHTSEDFEDSNEESERTTSGKSKRQMTIAMYACD
jgi:hypothetical protein